jgi:glycosyltransferase involved in cell wall biosynthesis
VSSALNAGIERANGELICWLSHDDLFPLEKLAIQVARLKEIEDPDHTILYGNYDIMDEKGIIYDHLKNPPTNKASFYEALLSKSVYVSTFCRKNFVLNGCTLMIPKQAFIETGLFNESLRTTQDYEMWFRLCRTYDFVQMEDVLLYSRRHANQGTITMWKRMKSESEEITLQALDLNKKGDTRTGLNLARTAFALRTNLGTSKASKILIRMALGSPRKTLLDSIFISMAMTWNIGMTYAKVALHLMRYRVKRKAAYKKLHLDG